MTRNEVLIGWKSIGAAMGVRGKTAKRLMLGAGIELLMYGSRVALPKVLKTTLLDRISGRYRRMATRNRMRLRENIAGANAMRDANGDESPT